MINITTTFKVLYKNKEIGKIGIDYNVERLKGIDNNYLNTLLKRIKCSGFWDRKDFILVLSDKKNPKDISLGVFKIISSDIDYNNLKNTTGNECINSIQKNLSFVPHKSILSTNASTIDYKQLAKLNILKIYLETQLLYNRQIVSAQEIILPKSIDRFGKIQDFLKSLKEELVLSGMFHNYRKKILGMHIGSKTKTLTIQMYHKKEDFTTPLFTFVIKDTKQWINKNTQCAAWDMDGILSEVYSNIDLYPIKTTIHIKH